MQVRERAHRVVEEHHTKARDEQVEARGLERVCLRIGADEGCGHAFALGTLACGGEHGFGDVDAHAATCGTEMACHGECRRPRAASDVEHLTPGSRSNLCDEPL